MGTGQNKQQKLLYLIQEMRGDTSVEDIWVSRNGEKKNVGLVNQFRLHKHIPNKWFDWTRTADAEIMIIGQDWGPYEVLRKFISSFDENRINDEKYYRKFLFKDFSSRTEKFILKTVEQTYQEKKGGNFNPDKWNNIFFTMAVLFTRQGRSFRGNEFFDPGKSLEHSYKYVSRQIDIMQPKLIITLGNMAFEVVNRRFSLGYKNPKITKVIDELGEGSAINAEKTTILPNFHPAAHVDPNIQTKIWEKMWDYSDV